ncbi:MAG: SusC/RagA family TonB-linked outer membrane protein [Muribaculaceae bacterium]|nr:SusC/RagA family TonB-linked outer membrane protein [Muribaculaceae bacterium]
MRKLFLILVTLMMCSWSAYAQNVTYHGTVLDAANNEPLIGATVAPIGGGQGVAADLDGKFTISVPQNVTKAKISYVGYEDQIADLVNNMTVRLHSKSTALNDVVVVAYGTANKESLTGSVAVVGSKDIEDRPVTTVTAALEGNAPGVQVNNSVGYPGSQPSILIRGYNTVNGVSSPLYVVDGVVYEGSIADLNPADIESMSVLKDAASAALYGNRGANGVILITTKRAKTAGKVDVTLQMRQGMYNRGLPFYERQDANGFMQTFFTGLVNSRLTEGTSADLTQAISDVRNNFFTYAFENVYGKPATELFDAQGKFSGNPLPGYTDLDWWDAVSRSGYRQEYNVNATGATDKFNVFASVGYLKENGYMLSTDFERFNGRLNTTFQPAKYFKMGVNLAAMYTKQNRGITSKDDEGYVNNPFLVQDKAPIFPYYAHDPETGEILRDGEGNYIWNSSSYLGNQGTNVAWTTRLDKKESTSAVIDGSAFATFIIPYGFELTVRGNIHRDKTNYWRYMTNENGSGVTPNGRLYQYDYAYDSHTFMQTLTWDHDYGMNHVDVLLDHENYQYTNSTHSVNVQNQLLPGIYSLSNFSTTNPASQQTTQIRSESYLGRVRYNYAQKYFGEASIRRDGSSYFEKDNRWGTFWSVGASWMINRENFMHDVDWVNYLKLRAAYGSVGNDASAGAYSYYNLYQIIKYNDVNSLVPIQLAAQNLKWEATRTFDVALEGSLFNDRFNFSVGYFNKRNTDLIFNVTQPLSGGTMSDEGANPHAMMNIGTMQNIGWELQFGVDIIRTKDFKWDFSVDATFNKNKIIKLPEAHDMPGNGWFLGKSLGSIYTRTWNGVDRVTGQSLYEIDLNAPSLTYWDEDGTAHQNESQFLTYVNNAASQGSLVAVPDGEGGYKLYTNTPAYATGKVQADAFPVVYGSFGTNLSWKGINFGMLFTYSLGGKVMDYNYQDLMNMSSEPRAIHKDLVNSWTQKPEGVADHEYKQINVNGVDFNAFIASADDIDDTLIPQLNTSNSAKNNGASSRWLTNASYLVLKNLNVSYDLPSKWSSALQMQNINIGMSIDNVFTATARKGMNPQYGFMGGQGKFYVPARVFAFQLNVKF